MNQIPSTVSIDWAAELSANGGWLSRVVYARVGDRHAVEDVLQELGMSIAKWPASLQGHDAVHRWLYSVAVRQALLYRRGSDRRRRRVSRYAENVTSRQDPPGPLDRLIASENAGLVQEGLQKLTGRQREILFMKYFDGWTCQQIAGKCGLRESTVQRHLVNARKRLRQELVKGVGCENAK